MSKIIPFILFWILGSSLIWIQTNGQFIWESFKNNPIILSLLFGSTISFIMITATRYGFDALNGSLWSIKWVGFAIGIIINALLNYFLMDEGVNPKTIVSLFLAIVILTIQIWE
jgi:hypothetical protein